MRDFFDKVPIYVVLVVVVSIVRAIMRAAKGGAAKSPPAGEGDTEEQRRVREIQERIRRIAAERRGRAGPAEPPPLQVPETAPPAVFRAPAPAAEKPRNEDSFRRQRPSVPSPQDHRAFGAEAERQTQLREQLRMLEEKKMLAQRQAEHAADARRELAASESALRTTARAALLDDLRDGGSLQRAFVLREVLGTPVGLR
jgi:hypothetical protein